MGGDNAWSCAMCSVRLAIGAVRAVCLTRSDSFSFDPWASGERSRCLQLGVLVLHGLQMCLLGSHTLLLQLVQHCSMASITASNRVTLIMCHAVKSRGCVLSWMDGIYRTELLSLQASVLLLV